MARAEKSADNIQVFRGSRPKADVFTANAGIGCCGSVDFSYDKLGDRVRFDNGLKHLSPSGGVERYRFPAGNGFSDDKAAIIAHINAIGVGAEISVIAIPTYAFVTGVGVHIAAEEDGLTFDLVTRNGLVLPRAVTYTATGGGEDPIVIEEVAGPIFKVTVTAGEGGCNVTRVPTTVDAFEGFGALGANDLFADLFARNGHGSFALEADELILRVASMPASGIVNGTFDLTVSASYDVIHRAEQ